MYYLKDATAEDQAVWFTEADDPVVEFTVKRYFVRLNLLERAQHLIFLICFIVLVITGFMLKLPESAVKLLGAYGEMVFHYRSILHRTAGSIMILVSGFHVLYLFLSPSGRRWLVDMLPRPKDAKDFFHNLFYYLGIKTSPPEYDRFNYKQKMEYGALIAGTTLMSATGALLWSEWLWNKFLLDIAAVVHGMEAVLASLAIMVWHLYEVHFNPHGHEGHKVWITGLIDEEEMKENHPLHYRRIMDDPKLRKATIRVTLVPGEEVSGPVKDTEDQNG